MCIFHLDSLVQGCNIWVRSRNCGCLVTWFCYQLIAKPGNKTAAVSLPDLHPLLTHWGYQTNTKPSIASIVFIWDYGLLWMLVIFSTGILAATATSWCSLSRCPLLSRSHRSQPSTPSTLVSLLKKYRKISNIRCTKCQNLNVSRLGLQLSLRNILKSSIMWRMKMQLEQRR